MSRFRLLLPAICCVAFSQLNAQGLTVEKIMKDPRWIGTSPNNVFWSHDSKEVYFDWNPEGNKNDSTYKAAIASPSAPRKAGYLESRVETTKRNSVLNRAGTREVYSSDGDIYIAEVKTGKITRITHTRDIEINPRFFRNDTWVVFQRGQNLYAWEINEGTTEQLTNFISGTETPTATAGQGGQGLGGGRGQGGFGGGQRGQGGGGQGLGQGAQQGSAARGANAPPTQDQWLEREQLRTSDVLKERHDEREARNAFLKRVRSTDTLKSISIGEKQPQQVQASPDGRFITYRLFTPAAGTKSTIVPNYVTESGYTTDIPGRTKVGAAQGTYELWIYDKEKDTLISVKPDSIPGINERPEFLKDYPNSRTRPGPRAVVFSGPSWNENGTAAVLEVRSQDNKDRWLMQLDCATGTLSFMDRQHDEAWVGGPGVSGFGSASGWIDDHTFYFQSEATGYSHLYLYDLNTRNKRDLTPGDYEVQQVVLGKDKRWFFLLTNETHPGKQQWHRMKADGTSKQQITSMEGGYEVSLSPDEKWIAYRYSYINKPWELYVQENQPGKKPVRVTDKAMSADFAAYPWRETKIFTITARDGKPIYSRIYEPAAGKKNGAAVVFVHGAGYLQNVHYWWAQYFREYMFNNLLADQGFTVIDIDYRGSSGYGRDWRTGIYRYMGGKDLDDEADAVAWLIKERGIDAKRIGMYGGSYGGFMTLMAVFTKPGMIHAGAALRPVTDWAHYNHGYTSNILNEPFNDSLAYARSSPINFAQNLQDHLLLCHGMVDTNVNFQDDVRLVQRLIELGKDNWELAVYPVEDHGFVEPSSWTDEYKRILKLFDTTLLP